MKSKCLAVVIPLVVTNAAHAQNSVTLYGVIDTGLTYVNNAGGHSLWEMQSGVMQGSRWGLKGAEDLGGGLKAIFQLENGFNVNTGKLGQNGREFGRQAWVGLASQYGSVKLGRQYDPAVDILQPTSFNGNYAGYFSHAGDIDNNDNSFRVNNSVKYISPSIGGVTFEGMYAFGGVAGSFGQNSTIAAGASYSANGLYVGAAYFYAKNPATQFDEASFVANPAKPGVPVNAGAFGYVGSPANMQVYGVGGTYMIGQATLGLDYTNTQFDGALGTTKAAKFFNYEAWGTYRITAPLLVGAGYTFTDTSLGYSSAAPRYHQVNTMIDYALSKRTDVYVIGSYVRAAGATTAAIFNNSISGPSSNNHQIVARIGIRHKF